jgi:hypothetical protein
LPVWLATIVHVPAATSEAFVPETVHTDAVVEAKLTARPELEVADRPSVVPTDWLPIDAKLMVCDVLPVPVPLRPIVCVLVVLSALSVNESVPLRAPAAVGVKLIDSWQDWPAASVAAEPPALTTGQADEPPLFNVKLAEMLGLLPLPGTGRLSAALPMFSTVTACGLSALVPPGAVGAKLKLGASDRSSFKTRLFPASAM